jgi:hypothetical protein
MFRFSNLSPRTHHPLLVVIPSVPGFPTSPLSPTTTYVVLLKENHMQLTEAATLDRKSGGAEGSAVRHSGAPHLQVYGLTTVVFTLREGGFTPSSAITQCGGPPEGRGVRRGWQASTQRGVRSGLVWGHLFPSE